MIRRTIIIHLTSVIKCLLIYMLGTILGVRSAAVNKAKILYDIYLFLLRQKQQCRVKRKRSVVGEDRALVCMSLCEGLNYRVILKKNPEEI